jgi:hypothetical protein
MEAKASIYIPYAFRVFQGFNVSDIKENQTLRHMEIVLEKEPDKQHFCSRCGEVLGVQDGRYWVRARHLRMFNWTVSVGFWREKRRCPNCRKIRSELIDWLCPTSPHMTMELAWWLTRMSEITSVLSVSKLESVDKMSCYRVDHYILARLLVHWIRSIMGDERFWNYWEHRVTTGLSEGINRAIKGLKWQAYGYKNMAYFALKIMQKCGYLNHRFYLQATATS